MKGSGRYAQDKGGGWEEGEGEEASLAKERDTLGSFVCRDTIKVRSHAFHES